MNNSLVTTTADWKMDDMRINFKYYDRIVYQHTQCVSLC